LTEAIARLLGGSLGRICVAHVMTPFAWTRFAGARGLGAYARKGAPRDDILLHCNIIAALRRGKGARASVSTFLALPTNFPAFALCKIPNSPKFSG
jgi:hypothetical protein